MEILGVKDSFSFAVLSGKDVKIFSRALDYYYSPDNTDLTVDEINRGRRWLADESFLEEWLTVLGYETFLILSEEEQIAGINQIYKNSNGEVESCNTFIRPEFRNKHLMSKLQPMRDEYLKKCMGIGFIRSRIKIGNTRSINAAKASGFIEEGEENGCLLMRREL